MCWSVSVDFGIVHGLLWWALIGERGFELFIFLLWWLSREKNFSLLRIEGMDLWSVLWKGTQIYRLGGIRLMDGFSIVVSYEDFNEMGIFTLSLYGVCPQEDEIFSQMVLRRIDLSSWVGKNVGEQKAVSMVPKKRIKLSHFDNSDLIAGYSKTLIGRCMNPRVQDMKTLLYMLRRIWQIEGKVAGAMVSLVRWSPSLNPNYSSDLTFWIRVLGVPIEFWADQTFREIGAALGSVQAVDVDAGRVRVTVDGFKPLSFETEIEYSNGEETTIEHHVLVEEKKDGNHLQSYRGAVTRQVSTFEGKNANGFQCKSVSEARKDDRNHNGASSSQPRKFASYTQVNDSRFSKVGGYGGKRKQQVVEELFVKESGGTQVKSTEVSQPKQVRKALFTTADQSMVAQMGVDADGPSIEVETAKEVLHEEGEITEATMVVNNMESSIPLSNVSGEENLDKVLSNELERGEQVFMSTKEVDEDDSMVSSPLQPEDPVDEVEKFAKKLMDATRLQEGVGAEKWRCRKLIPVRLEIQRRLAKGKELRYF
ncbi:hypothetical protein ISN45_At02g006630 [Arabidopsis thaliana x Arabidopsis arenosa]|uniref:DUF4283 domain-containing protein n=1 Tax=Arabidopsis thaliana x Arabidopsis arenosa TaxID=1240361 RepID=A0A8T2FIB8_9BRAS|nr:hypothetical protein ISN45_At02g006630 [Arabidopsis thaliana x Arabidopsis arenosa]